MSDFTQEWVWGTALAAASAGAFVLMLVFVRVVNCAGGFRDIGADEAKGCCTQTCDGKCWKPFKTCELWSVIVSLLHYATVSLGWLVVIWGGILIGSLFRTLNDVDFWWLFAVWMTENLTKSLYMHPEGDFYRKFSLEALTKAAKHKFNSDICSAVWLQGITLLSCFDSSQFGFAVGRLVAAAMALHVLPGAARCGGPSESLPGSFVFLYNTTSDAAMARFELGRVCSALMLFYWVVVAKAVCSILKYPIVVCMADIGGKTYCAEGLVSILVHEQHGFMTKADVDAAVKCDAPSW